MKRTTSSISSMVNLLFVIASTITLVDSFSLQKCVQYSPAKVNYHYCPHYGCCNTADYKIKTKTTRRYMANANNDNDSIAFLSDDPFKILGLEEPTADKKVLKRAYKKRALKFHPDVITDLHSTSEDKKKASDRFAKINWAYETLMGKNRDGSSGSSTGQPSSSSTSSSSWTPPHRRKGEYSSSSSSSSSPSSDSNDWRDFMPNYGNFKETYDEEYDTGGDSFGQIFSDLFTSAATGAAGVASGIGSQGGIFAEFIDFLEGNVGGGTNNDGFNSENDAGLKSLLETGSLESIAEEMDDTELVVRQLESKATALDDELLTTDAEVKMASKFSEQIKLEERADELKARKNVVGGYLKRSRTRLLALQIKYKELITDGANDSYATSGGRRRASDPSSYSSSSSTRENNSSSNDDDRGDSGKTREGFGASSRGRSSRGSARRRGTRRTPTTTAAAESVPGNDTSFSTGYTSSSSPPPQSSDTSRTDAPYSSSRNSNNRRQPQKTSSSSSSSSSSLNKYGEIPPHRRTQSYVSQQEDDSRRMREIKVDEEFDKLKKELGL